MAVEVNLNAYVLPNDHRVYKLFPGKGYKFYNLISESSVALIDVRDLDALGDDPRLWASDELLTHIAHDRIDRAVAKGAKRPSRVVRSQGDKATQTFLEGLFFKAKKGDLILMPQKEYTSKVMVGKLADDPGNLEKISAVDDKQLHTYYGRRVEWLGEIEKRLLSGELINLLHSPAAFFDVGRSQYDAIYRVAFDNFVYDRQFVATFRTGKSIFTPKDNFLASVWLELLEVLEEAREGGSALPAGSIYELVIDSNIDEDDRDDLSINVQSPGWFRIRSVVAAPLASLAMFAMAVGDVPYSEAITASVHAEVIREANSECLGDVDASVRDYIKLLGKDRWEQACVLAKQAEIDAKLKVDAQVQQVARKEES